MLAYEATLGLLLRITELVSLEASVEVPGRELVCCKLLELVVVVVACELDKFDVLWPTLDSELVSLLLVIVFSLVLDTVLSLDVFDVTESAGITFELMVLRCVELETVEAFTLSSAVVVAVDDVPCALVIELSEAVELTTSLVDSE